MRWLKCDSALMSRVLFDGFGPLRLRATEERCVRWAMVELMMMRVMLLLLTAVSWVVARPALSDLR